MLGSEFYNTFAGTDKRAWEAAALEAAREGSVVAWPMVPISLSATGPSGQAHTAVLPVASDVFAIGTPQDFLRLPLTPGAAQSVANLGGFLLPTPKIAYEVWKAAKTQGVQLVPSPQLNRAPLHLIEDYALHDRTVNAQLLSHPPLPPGLISGHKKDVIVSNIYKTGHVLIYGWFFPEGYRIPVDPKTGKPVYSQPIQGRSNVHDDQWVDYSHGIRLVSPVMTVDGETRRTEDVLRDVELSRLLSDEGPVHVLRYPAQNDPQPYRPVDSIEYQSYNDVYPKPLTTSLADQGLAAMMAQAAASRKPRP